MTPESVGAASAHALAVAGSADYSQRRPRLESTDGAASKFGKDHKDTYSLATPDCRASRPLRRRAAALGALACLLLVPTAHALGDGAGDTYLRYDGEARAADGGALLYREHHVLHYRDGVLTDRIVVYDCANGAPFARKTLKYAPSALAPDLRFDDARTGISYVLETTAGGRRLRSRDSAGSP